MTAISNAGKGLVGGVLWYFPCENGCETTPLECGSGLSAPVAGQQGEGVMTQWEGMTQQTSCTQRAITVDGKLLLKWMEATMINGACKTNCLGLDK
jgi:hypothetical protein